MYTIASSLGLFFWLRKFNLVEHERRDWGLAGMGLLLMCIPVYVSAAVQAICRKPLTYAVTAKGDLSSPDSLKTFRPHLMWLGFNALILLSLYETGRSLFVTNSIWTVEHMAVCVLPIAIYAMYRLRMTTMRLAHSLQHAVQAFTNPELVGATEELVHE
jgi:hypothetical protein